MPVVIHPTTTSLTNNASTHTHCPSSIDEEKYHHNGDDSEKKKTHHTPSTLASHTLTMSSSSTSHASSSHNSKEDHFDEADAEMKEDQSHLSEPNKKVRHAPLMTLEAIRKICKTHKDLYENIELNEKLFLNFAGFESIDSLQHFPDLRNLWLENNKLTSLVPVPPSTGLTTLTKLRCLYLQNNHLANLRGIEACASLVLLNVSSNHLTTLDGVATLRHLQILDAHDNELSDVTDELRKMAPNSSSAARQPALHTLDLSQNKLTVKSADDVDNAGQDDELPSHQQPVPELFQLLASALPKLKVVYLKQNPLVEQVTQYRRLLSSLLPSLSFLDDRPVTALDRECAVAWKTGGSTTERQVRSQTLAEKRAKEERNMREWMKQKQERVAQLAALRQEAEEKKKLSATTSASHVSSDADAEADADSTTDPSLGTRVYHSASAPIPASPYHGEIPAVEYSTWVRKQEAIEEGDQQAIKRAKVEQQLATPAASSASSSAATNGNARDGNALDDVPATAAVDDADDLPTSSYLADDPSDDPEIGAMKRMLKEVFVKTQTMKLSTSNGVASSMKRSHNIGVDEAAIIDATEEGETATSPTATAAPGHVNATSANSVTNDETTSAAPTATAGSSSSKAVSELPTAESLSHDAPPNTYSILNSQTIAQIYDEVAVRLPTVSMSDDEDENDVTDVDSEEEVDDGTLGSVDDLDGVKSPGRSASVKSPSSNGSSSKSKLPKIFGFGPEDRHLIDKPFFGSLSGAGSHEDVSDDLVHAHQDWTPSHVTPSSSSTASASASASVSSASNAPASGKMTLADLLESRRAARLGTAAATTSANRRSTSNIARTAIPADLLALDDTPSSSATGITAQTLLQTFIQAQSSPPPTSSIAPASALSSSDDKRYRLEEREQKNEIFMAASNALNNPSTTRRTSGSDDDEEDEDDDDDDSEGDLPVDPRQIAIDARRAARQGR